MLFNSYGFIGVFLPLTLAGFFLAGRFSVVLAAAWLGLASLVFYAWWDVRFTALLLGSIALNYAGGRLLLAAAARGDAGARKWLLRGFVGADLLILGFFKYLNFFAVAASQALHTDLALPQIVLPIGISFFTFTQIAFLVDTARGQAGPTSLVHYLLFVTYFPHLIAGPVLHHAEMIPQFRNYRTYSPRADAIAVGVTVFMLGLFKKVVLADEIGEFAKDAFWPWQSHTIGFTTAWCGALAYTMQIYFDFSAYTDMAIDLSRAFNISLPANFESPYKACSIIDFWRRWHMTLSRFLRDYLYIPLGGNRSGVVRRYGNLMVTMLLGGLWHGAGWTFLIWGGLHGFYLVVNHGWRAVGFARFGGNAATRLAGWALTFVSVVVAWVFFRAPDPDTAFNIVAAMLHGFALTGPIPQHEVSLLAMLMILALCCPNVREIMAREELVIAAVRRRAEAIAPFPALPLRWRPTLVWATASFALFVTSLLEMTHVSQFLYFQF
jgi:D-alanyl-lipoteichoic acid acyltransferase DltB (MBOAT superfamily)